MDYNFKKFTGKFERGKLMSSQAFVKKYLEYYRKGITSHELSDLMDMDFQKFSVKASYLKKRGVKLPSLSRRRKGLDIDKLNKLIKESIKE